MIWLSQKILRIIQSDHIGQFVLRAISGAFAVNIAGRLVSFVLMVVLARLLGVQDFGVYVLAWSWGQILLVFAKFGSDASAMRYVSLYKAKEEWGLFHGHMRYGVGLVFLKSTLLFVVSSGIIWFYREQIGLEFSKTLLIVMVLLPVLSLVHFLQGALRAFRLPVKGMVSNTVLRPLFQTLLIGGLFLFGVKASASGAMFMALVASVFALGLTGWWLFKEVKVIPKVSRPVYEVKEWYKYAALILLIASGDMIFRQTDVVMLGALAGAGEAGLYSAASRIAYFVVFGVSAANFVVAPLMSEFHAVEGHRKMQRLLTLSAQMIFALALGVSMVIWIGGHWLLGFFGQDFIQAQATLNILTLGQLCVTFAGPIGSLMIMTGHEKFTSRVFVMTALVNLVLNALLIPSYGKEGAAIATAVSFMLWNIICVAYVVRYLKINPTPFSLVGVHRGAG